MHSFASSHWQAFQTPSNRPSVFRGRLKGGPGTHRGPAPSSICCCLFRRARKWPALQSGCRRRELVANDAKKHQCTGGSYFRMHLGYLRTRAIAKLFYYFYRRAVVHTKLPGEPAANHSLRQLVFLFLQLSLPDECLHSAGGAAGNRM